MGTGRPQKSNQYLMLENNRIGIVLTQNQVAIIDASCFALVGPYTWYASWDKTVRSFYAKTNVYSCDTKKQRNFSMHRMLMRIIDRNIKVDHRNHDTLDNTCDNLRLATNSESACNRRVQKHSKTKVKNIWWDKAWQKWKVKIVKNNVSYYAFFESIFDALDWRDAERERLHADFNYSLS